MDTTRNVLQECFGADEYAELLISANQISIFGEPVKELSREELLAALTFTMKSSQGYLEQNTNENNFRPLPADTQRAGLW